MSARMAQDDDARYIATDPKDLEVGDRVIVEDIADDVLVRGSIQAKIVEAGRYCIEVRDDDNVVSSVWEEAGRSFTVVEEAE